LKVSALIPTYNRRKYIFRAIDSVLAQTVPVDEVIVVDDGSSDGTAEALRARYGSLVAVFRQNNMGVSAARRRAVEESRGEWVAFLDSDDEWLPDRNALLLRAASSVPKRVAWIFGDTRFVTDQGEGDTVFGTNGLILDRDLRTFDNPLSELVWDIARARPQILESSLVRRSALVELKCFNEELRLAEDFLASLKVASRYSFAGTPAVVTKAYRTPDLRQSSLEVHEWGGGDQYRAGIIGYALAAQVAGRRPWAKLHAECLRRLCRWRAERGLPIRRLALDQFKLGISIRSICYLAAAMLGSSFFCAGSALKRELKLTRKHRQAPLRVSGTPRSAPVPQPFRDVSSQCAAGAQSGGSRKHEATIQTTVGAEWHMDVLMASYMAPRAVRGVTTYYELLLRDAAAHGVHTRLVTPADCSRIVHYGTAILRRLLVRTGCLRGANSILIENIVCWLRLRSALGRIRRPPDLVHAQEPGSACAAVRAFKGNVPVITTCHFNDDPTDESLGNAGIPGDAARLLRRWHGFTFRHTRNWISVSRYATGQLLRLVPSGAIIEVIHNGVDFDAASRVLPNKALREEYKGKTLILNVGTLEPRKNQDLLLKIASFLREQPLVFLLAGDGPDWSRISSEIARLRLSESVRLLGRREDVPSLMRACDIYVHTAKNENCPFTLIEAMAAGLPVLALASGGTPELLPGGDGRFPSTASPESVARRIALWAAQPELRHRIAEHQREYARSEFNLDQMIRRTVEAYRKILHESASIAIARIEEDTSPLPIGKP
jgi:glycosyltransferase involved in cell wall biosynthesis